MGKKGRPKGSITKHCLIKDPLLEPYEVHVDEGAKCYVLVNSKTGKTEGYYTTLPYLVKYVLSQQYIPVKGNNKTYTLKEYITGLNKITNDMRELLVPPHTKI